MVLFGFWMELSMGIMLYGAKLTHVFDRQNDEKIARMKKSKTKKPRKRSAKSTKIKPVEKSEPVKIEPAE